MTDHARVRELRWKAALSSVCARAWVDGRLSMRVCEGVGGWPPKHACVREEQILMKTKLHSRRTFDECIAHGSLHVATVAERVCESLV
jgi:hypothetical protein